MNRIGKIAISYQDSNTGPLAFKTCIPGGIWQFFRFSSLDIPYKYFKHPIGSHNYSLPLLCMHSVCCVFFADDSSPLFVTNSTLTIGNLMDSDRGMYRCVASSQAFSTTTMSSVSLNVSRSLQLDVLGKWLAYHAFVMAICVLYLCSLTHANVLDS